MKEKNMLMYVMVGLAVLLLVASVFQTVQVNAIADGGTGLRTSGGESAPAASPAPRAPAPAAQPAMIGGC